MEFGIETLYCTNQHFDLRIFSPLFLDPGIEEQTLSFWC
jgi:hypothetical protein